MADIYVDSCLIISLIEGSIRERVLLIKYLSKHFIYSSELARLESRILAIKRNDLKSIQKFERFFAECEMIELDRAIFEQATLLRTSTKLKTPDALHLAVAIQSGCQEFWTDDKQLKAIANQHLRVVDWALLAEQEAEDLATDE